MSLFGNIKDLLSGRSRRLKQAEVVLRELCPVTGQAKFDGLPAGDLREVLQALEQDVGLHCLARAHCETEEIDSVVCFESPHTLRLALNSCSGVRADGAPVPRACLYVTRLGPDSWTWYRDTTALR